MKATQRMTLLSTALGVANTKSRPVEEVRRTSTLSYYFKGEFAGPMRRTYLASASISESSDEPGCSELKFALQKRRMDRNGAH